ncbi:MAG: 16S rRNA (cytidine(1402)-2'-O)-methyltransferase [Gemmatimonadetes bacterium]|nr:16S rRNA (cytidine(1402)-2'-O)-methyltransferase [Gemmatimonadota bacterium]
MSHLYIVSTPIGNLADITYRAVEVLRAVDRILAEDTRRTSILLRHYGIDTPLVSAHEHNEAARVARVVAWLDAGEELALVSDAGTPLLSDPGARIVQGAVGAGHVVVPVPGASALLAGLVVSGLPMEPFTFYGFLPRSGGERAERLAEIAALTHTAVLYEAPGRLARLLAELEEHCGPERDVAVARELTKLHESVVRGTVGEVRRYYEAEGARGEVVVVVGGRSAVAAAEDVEAAARRRTRELLEEGLRPSAAAKRVADAVGIPRNRAYEIALALARESGGDTS